MKWTKYILFVVSMAAILYGIDALKWHYEPLALNGIAMEPVVHLVNSNSYYDEHEEERALRELEEAVRKTMILKEEITHKKSLELLEVGLPSLVKLLNTTQHISDEELNGSCSKMLIALSYMQVHSAKVSLMEERPSDMKESLGNAMFILKKALMITNGPKRNYEVAIYSKMSEMFDHDLEIEESMIQLDEILDQLQFLEVSVLDGDQLAGNTL